MGVFDKRASRHWLVLVGLVLLAVVLRIFRWMQADTLFADGPRFLQIAQSAYSGQWNAVWADDFHPLYSLLTAFLYPVIGDWEVAAVTVSIVGGALSVVFLFGLIRGAFDVRVALVAAALLAIHPRAVDFSSDVQSEGLYMAVFLGALWCGYRALESHGFRWAVWCGLLSGAAYWTRPEGLGVIGVFAVVAVAEAIYSSLPSRRAVGLVVTVVLSSLLIAGPYIAMMSYDAGELTLTRKKSIGVVLGIRDPETVPSRSPSPSAPVPRLQPPAQSAPDALSTNIFGQSYELLRKSIKAFRYEYALLLVLGLWSVRGSPHLRGRFFGALILGYGVVLYGLLVAAGYVSRRHCLPVLIPLLGYSALGVYSLGNGILRVLHFRILPRWGLIVFGVCPILLSAAISFSEERESHHLAERRAGEWLAATFDSPRVVASNRVYGPYYARAEYLPIEPCRYALDADRLLKRGATHVILREEKLSPEEWKEVLSQERMHLIKQYSANGENAFILSVAKEK